MTKPWQPLTADDVARLAGHLGVYELADENGEIVLIGFAGGRSSHGLKGELQAHLQTPPANATRFRVEVTMAYRTRHLELLQAHVHDHDRLPSANREARESLGRLRPA